MNKYDITYFTPNGCNNKPIFISDNVIKYACVLFNAFGAASLINNKYSQYIYFHKLVNIETCSIMENVEGYEKKSVVSKKVWVKRLKCNNGTICNDRLCTYVEDEVIKQKFRNYLLDFYATKKQELLFTKNLLNVHYFEEEINNICNFKYNEHLLEVEKDIEVLSKLLFESVLFIKIMKLCEFFFEYKNEIIEKWTIHVLTNDKDGSKNYFVRGAH
jgi:hypothetical protein